MIRKDDYNLESWKGGYASTCSKFIDGIIRMFCELPQGPLKQIGEDTLQTLAKDNQSELNGKNIYKYIYWANTWFCPSMSEGRYVGRIPMNPENEEEKNWVQIRRVTYTSNDQEKDSTYCVQTREHLKNYLRILNPEICLFFTNFSDKQKIVDMLPSDWNMNDSITDTTELEKNQKNKKCPFTFFYKKSDDNVRLVLSLPHPSSMISDQFIDNVVGHLRKKMPLC